MISRSLEPVLQQYAQEFPVVAVLGPRQSGKTTVVQKTFPEYRYINFENLDSRTIAQTDPRGFLESLKHETGVILDEFQHVPEILSYIQVIVDATKKLGFFVLTGSQNFLLNEKISQTLAGRVGILTLLPLSIEELAQNSLLPESLDDLMVKGLYPRLYIQKTTSQRWYESYLQTYIERDVRLIKNIENLGLFQKFIQLCAARIGQIINLSSLATDCGISVPTARSWISLLETSYIAFSVQPYYNNINKRLTKTAKLFFYDTGLVCMLLGIKTSEQLSMHYLRGGIMESFVISEFYKEYYNQAQRPRIYFWRDTHGHEIDCIIEKSTHPIPIEIKAGQTFVKNFTEGIVYWNKINGMNKGYVVYGGNETYLEAAIAPVGWRDIPLLFKKLS